LQRIDCPQFSPNAGVQRAAFAVRSRIELDGSPIVARGINGDDLELHQREQDAAGEARRHAQIGTYLNCGIARAPGTLQVDEPQRHWVEIVGNAVHIVAAIGFGQTFQAKAKP